MPTRQFQYEKKWYCFVSHEISRQWKRWNQNSMREWDSPNNIINDRDTTTTTATTTSATATKKIWANKQRHTHTYNSKQQDKYRKRGWTLYIFGPRKMCSIPQNNLLLLLQCSLALWVSCVCNGGLIVSHLFHLHALARSPSLPLSLDLPPSLTHSQLHIHVRAKSCRRIVKIINKHENVCV